MSTNSHDETTYTTMPPILVLDPNPETTHIRDPCSTKHCGIHYSRFSVNSCPIDCCKKVKIPGTTSLPKLC